MRRTILYDDVANIVSQFPGASLAESIRKELASQRKSTIIVNNTVLDREGVYALCRLLCTADNLGMMSDSDKHFLNALFKMVPKFFLDVFSWAHLTKQCKYQVRAFLDFCNRKNIVDHETLWFEYLMTSFYFVSEQFHQVKNYAIVNYLEKFGFDEYSIVTTKSSLVFVVHTDFGDTISQDLRYFFEKGLLTKEGMLYLSIGAGCIAKYRFPLLKGFVAAFENKYARAIRADEFNIFVDFLFKYKSYREDPVIKMSSNLEGPLRAMMLFETGHANYSKEPNPAQFGGTLFATQPPQIMYEIAHELADPPKVGAGG